MSEMRKIIIQKELICPFKICRVFSLSDGEDNKEMDVYCESCAYIWDRKSTLVGYSVTLYEDSKEYKEYEMLHTPICDDSELKKLQIEDIMTERTMDELSNLGIKVHNNKDIIGTFNKNVAEK